MKIMNRTLFIMGYVINMEDNFEDMKSFNSFIAGLKKNDEKPEKGQPYFLIADYDPEYDDVDMPQIAFYMAYDHWMPNMGKFDADKLSKMMLIEQNDDMDDKYYDKLNFVPYYGLYLENVNIDNDINIYTL